LPFCHQCGHNLDLGIKKFCPNCGYNLNKGQTGMHSFDFSNNQGDVFGAGFTGNGNLMGKEIGYTVIRNVINFHVSGNVPK
jgi:hypothetical protein